MSDSQQYGVVRLSDEDRKLLKAAVAALAGSTAVPAAAGKGTKPAAGKGTKPKPAAEDLDDGLDGDTDGEDGDGEDDFEATDGEDGDGEDGDGEPAATRSDVQAALLAYSRAVNNKDKAFALLEKLGGVKALSKLKEEKFAAVIAGVNAATAKVKKAK